MSIFGCIIVSCISSIVTSLVWFLVGRAREKEKNNVSR